jgi:hypothetical protein
MVNKVFSGSIDAISPAGFVEGWALANKNHFETVSVCILANDKPIGAGVANLFRSDLLTLGVGHGWHAFRIRVDLRSHRRRVVKFSLVDFKSTALIAEAKLRCPRDFAGQPLTVDSVLENGLEVTEMSSLKLAEPIMAAFITKHGVEKFVDCGYCYVLGRPADPDGQASYAALIGSGKMAPLGFLATLFDSEERQQSKWSMRAPSDPGFIFAPALIS